jgi:heme-degrading monooxygenase HmoA
MIEIVWEYVIKEEVRGQFELTFGPGGDWNKLFAGCPGFRGTTILRDVKDPRRYLSIDLWETETQWEQALDEHKEKVANLEAAFAEWAQSHAEVGIFRVLAEATVRPSGKVRRSRARGAHGRSGRTKR